jgi:hypothetical protein
LPVTLATHVTNLLAHAPNMIAWPASSKSFGVFDSATASRPRRSEIFRQKVARSANETMFIGRLRVQTGQVVGKSWLPDVDKPRPRRIAA